ncbi:DNA polymerase III, chi subunit [Fontimonas thermophila]|uniref:DNA polymerase III, chi subunit n=1 Tax=Fontimonas thermophila TaxID=1076937 RepID=A0A1I2IQ64_9GAMM|nr:DNA polymerase III subunit chi [Fontimonas thermophila]SFF44445.1 DNA polymerase III, chi subunit [Fontimonas thermophila]
MTRIDFYILPEMAGPADSAVLTACRLCDKATAAGKQVYVHADAATAEDIDGALWSFRQGSFIAHELYHGQALAEPLPAVLIGVVEPPDSHHDILVNLGREVPDYFSRFERVLEIVAGDAAQRAAARERYRFYRDRGYPLNSYEQNAAGAWVQRAR